MVRLTVDRVDLVRSGYGFWPRVVFCLNGVQLSITQIEGGLNIRDDQEDRDDLDVFDLAELVVADVEDIMAAHEAILAMPDMAIDLIECAVQDACQDMAKALESVLGLNPQAG